MRDMWSMPRTGLVEAPPTVQAVKLAEEVGEVMEAVLMTETTLNDYKIKGLGEGKVPSVAAVRKLREALASELFDVIQVASNMLAGLDVQYEVDLAKAHAAHITKMGQRERDYNL